MPGHSASEDARKRAYDPGIHRKSASRRGWIAGSSPAMTAVVPRLGALLPDRELLLTDHLGPFAGLRPDVVGELFRRARHRLEHLWRQEFFAELRIRQDLGDLGVDLGHDLARRAGGREQAEPGRGFVAR